MVFHPEAFTTEEIDQLAEEHRDVVAFAISTGGVVRWVWIADGWPAVKDVRTLQ